MNQKWCQVSQGIWTPGLTGVSVHRAFPNPVNSNSKYSTSLGAVLESSIRVRETEYMSSWSAAGSIYDSDKALAGVFSKAAASGVYTEVMFLTHHQVPETIS